MRRRSEARPVSRFRLMADGFNIVSIGIDDKGRIVGRTILKVLSQAVHLPHRQPPELPDRRHRHAGASGGKGDVEWRRLLVGLMKAQ